MTRGYWAGVMLISLLASGAVGWFVYNRLDEKQIIEVPLKQVQAGGEDTPAPADNAAPGPDAVDPEESSPDLDDSSTILPDEATNVGTGPRTVQITYRNPAANNVSVIGDFNKWYRKPLKKNNGVWTLSMDLNPGTYRYKLVVDGKRIVDPGNSAVKDGNSLIVVKAAP